ncbi:acyl--CoA ligase [Aquabacterium sp. A7-Y]|uniref:class I adenylate-forming enzyme family protein n=1 Tax=Aquabacterium sp. A7-Y TaxID=1349605 RepID=UPI00223CF7F6|nr:class I adenylate-forming enzyme family protein [Aquabacterium sp. A7-Y]MCW7541672.1 acyl--CoA ligase [Aquabacterium sp. A7-Y]
MLLHHPFEATARRCPDKIALVSGVDRLSYAEVERRAAQVAAELQAAGVAPGDRVALLLDNGVEWVAALFGVLQAGAVLVPLHASTKTDKLARLLQHTRAAALLTQLALAPVYRPALERCPELRLCGVVGGAATGIEQPFPGPADGGVPRPVERIDQDLAAILYTSGSTGSPKGVMQTHLSMRSAAASVMAYLDLREDDILLNALPLSFGYGLYQVLMAFTLGATVVLERSFSFPARIVETLAREAVTVFPGVPTMFSLLLAQKGFTQQGLPALRLLTSAAAALPESHIAALRERLPQARLYSMYGQTECKRISYLPPEELARRPGSVGRGMPNQECWLVDAEGQRLPHGASGELVVRGSHLMRGYWEQPEESARRLRPGPLPGEQVLYTGDIFRSDAEGYLYFVARQDDLIKTRGEKVSPREVEDALYALDPVQDAAVVGVPHETLGQAVKAYVVLRPGACLGEREVMRHCMARLESYMVPQSVCFVDALPRTESGKIHKAGLAAAAVSPLPYPDDTPPCPTSSSRSAITLPTTS